MKPHRLLRSLAGVLSLLALLLAAPNAARSQVTAPGPMDLAPEARARLAQAASDSRVAPWQRDFMLRMARTGTPAAMDSSSADPGAAPPVLLPCTVDGAWNQVTVPARDRHTAVYDPVRDRMVVFGGCSGPYLNDVWALSLAGTPAWTQLSPSGSTPPVARYSHTAIYDPVRDRMVVFGGSSGSGRSSLANDVWALGWCTTCTVVDWPQAQPLIAGLRPPAPNPTRGTTAVSFALAQSGRVQLGVYDVSGRRVRQLVDGERRAGIETVVWNGTAESGARVGAGVYFVRLAGPGIRDMRRVILLR